MVLTKCEGNPCGVSTCISGSRYRSISGSRYRSISGSRYRLEVNKNVVRKTRIDRRKIILVNGGEVRKPFTNCVTGNEPKGIACKCFTSASTISVNL